MKDREEAKRLNAIRDRVRETMLAGGWWTIGELVTVCGGSHTGTGVAAKMRDLRKPRYGGWTRERGGFRVDRRNCGEGVWQYHLRWEGPEDSTAPPQQLGLPLGGRAA